ncbi:MAG TPA: AraC family transcriptional regulator, partial [Alcanivorax sp.]|nr:AraC family transcriptional regulator [Alcanivorax sp.]
MVDQPLPAGTAPGLLDIVLRGRPDRATLFQQAGLDADTVAGGDGHLTSAQLDALLGTAFTQA